MADIADDAQFITDMHLMIGLENARSSGIEKLTGFCKWCNEPSEGVYCSTDCRNDSDKHERLKG